MPLTKSCFEFCPFQKEQAAGSAINLGYHGGAWVDVWHCMVWYLGIFCIRPRSPVRFTKICGGKPLPL